MPFLQWNASEGHPDSLQQQGQRHGSKDHRNLLGHNFGVVDVGLHKD